MPTLAELEKQITDTREGFLKVYNGAPKKKLADGSEAPDLSGEQLKTLKDMQDDLDVMGADRDVLKKAYDAHEHGWAPLDEPEPTYQRKSYQPNFGYKSPTRRIMDELSVSGSNRTIFADGAKGKTFEMDPFEFKATMVTTSGYPPEVVRDGDVVLAIARPPQLIDYVPSYVTTQSGLKWTAETTFTPASATTSENAALTAGTFVYQEQTGIITRIGSHVPVTEEELEDVMELQGLIEGRLRFGAEAALDSQILIGNGTPPNLRGLYNATNVQTATYDGVTAGLETVINTLGTAMKNVQLNAYANPNIVIMHATDLWKLAMVRDSQGRYIFANPADAPLNRIWGIAIVRSDALTAGTALVGDTTHCALARRKEMTFEIGYQNDDFTKSLKTLKLSGRYGLKIRRGQAFCRAVSLP